MTILQLKTKIQLLETWLISNPNSTERALVESDLKQLKKKLNKND